MDEAVCKVLNYVKCTLFYCVNSDEIIGQILPINTNVEMASLS